MRTVCQIREDGTNYISKLVGAASNVYLYVGGRGRSVFKSWPKKIHQVEVLTSPHAGIPWMVYGKLAGKYPWTLLLVILQPGCEVPATDPPARILGFMGRRVLGRG